MNTMTPPTIERLAESPARPRAFFSRMLLHVASLLVGLGCYVAYEHFKLRGESTQALASLIAAAVFVLAPFRLLIGGLFFVERKVMHLVHGVLGLGLVGLTLGGAVSGGPLLSHAALAPFALMGAAQAVMHQNHPRNAQQAAALRRFASSLQEVQQFAGSKQPTSPENIARSVSVLHDILSKAQALGETELAADPNFQSALQRATTRFGLTLGLDSVDRVIDKLATNPAAAGAVPGLRRQLAHARATLDSPRG
ncbi:MAG TPA: hypothetical protein VMG11_00365 [Steroidobacteraceae bacterium]|nr:hypothetical protein [Steroidobacteraceae bacterium]